MIAAQRQKDEGGTRLWLQDICRKRKGTTMRCSVTRMLISDAGQSGLASGLPVKGNKKKAEGFLQEQRRSFEIPLADQPIAKDGQELFADYLQRWLQVAKTTVAPTTYGSYGGLLRNPIDPWFRKKRITLQGLTASDLQAFYMEQGRRVKPNTVIHYHAVIHRALKYAVKMDLISVNPADKVDRPRKNGYQANFYSESEIAALFAAISDTLIEVPVKLAAFYGLRRSEVMGLRWDAVDFVHNTICIRHTVTGCTIGRAVPDYRGGHDQDSFQPPHPAACAYCARNASPIEGTAGTEPKNLRSILQPGVCRLHLRQ